jgi:hypothetical protein
MTKIVLLMKDMAKDKKRDSINDSQNNSHLIPQSDLKYSEILLNERNSS